MSGANSALFLICAAMALFGALGTVLSRRPLRAAMALLLHITALSGLYLSLHAELLAALQLLVYAGAVVVLFVFVIMLIGPASALAESKELSMMKAVGVGAVAIVGLGLAAGLHGIEYVGFALPADYGSVSAVAGQLYTKASVPFELVSATLVVAIVGAIGITRGRAKKLGNES